MPSSTESVGSSTVVPPRYATKTLATFEPRTASQRKALEAARSFVEGGIHSLVLLGPPGTGKSHLAAAVLTATLERLRREHEASWVAYDERLASLEPMDPARQAVAKPDRSFVLPAWLNVPELLTGLRADMDLEPFERSWGQRVKRATSAPLLVLDDLGRERVSDWTGELVYVLANTRYEAGRPTIATSNLSPDELGSAGYWPAISRLAEDGLLIRIDAPDRRLARPPDAGTLRAERGPAPGQDER